MLIQKDKNKLLKIGFGIILCSLVFNLRPVHAQADSWDDNFTSMQDWKTLRLDCSSWGACGTLLPIPLLDDSNLTAKDGMLKAPADSDLQFVDVAIHNSSIAYGTWSWDVEISPDYHGFNSTLDIIGFIYNGANWNVSSSGFTWDGTTGYYFMISQTFNDWHTTGPGLTLSKDDLTILGSYRFSLFPSGNHHIDITRNSTGHFKVFFDSELKIQAHDNNVTTSEEFALFSWKGDSAYDNLSVSDNIKCLECPTDTSDSTDNSSSFSDKSSNDPPTTPTANIVFTSVLLASVTLVLVRKRNRI